MNKRNIKTVLSVLFLSLAVSAFGDESETVKLKSFKCILDGARYVYSGGKNIPENPNDSIRLETVFSYTELRPGMSLPLKALEKKLEQLQLRLERSGLFMNVEIYIIPPRKNPDERTVMLKLNTGMLFRFSSGAAYACWSALALDGRRDRLDTVAGANRILLAYRNENIGGRGVAGAFSLQYNNSVFDPVLPADLHEITAAGETGLFFHPDIYCGIKMAVHSSSYTNIEPGAEGLPDTVASFTSLVISPRLAFQFPGTRSVSGFLMFGVDLIWSPGLSSALSAEFASVIQAEGRISLRSGPVFLASTGFCRQAFSALPFPEKQDIAADFRSPLSFSDGLTDSLLSGGCEAGLTLFSFQIFSIFPVKVSAFAFCDFVYLSGPGFLEENGIFAEAFGTGLRVSFAAPVYVNINLSAGWNRRGEYKINFSVNGG